MTDVPAPLLAIDDLSKSYGKLRAVEALSFSLNPGELVGFIGPNGAGKSSTMKSIVGLLEAEKGSVSICGIDVRSEPVRARAELGYVGQDLEVYQYLSAEELLRFIAGIRGIPSEEGERRIADLLELCELQSARGRLIREFSGGMARKIAIAAALIGKPKLLLLDEAFVGLDPESTFRIQRRLQSEVEAGAAVLLSSHVLDMLERICSRILVMHQGHLVADLSRAELEERFQNPKHPDLTRLYLHLTDQASLMD
ncbi:MAG: ABC transporter ATP-binding protein [Myxococcota bacterium]|jgi:ABC-2 type transport system ATP-binding protein|nr:ABC transporter ATP-binding protein [Myxococcota bacterium]